MSKKLILFILMVIFTVITLNSASAAAIQLVSNGTGGNGAQYYSEYPSISNDGKVIAFVSSAPDLIPGAPSTGSNLYVYNRVSKKTELITKGSGSGADGTGVWSPSASGDGNTIAFTSTATNLIPGTTCNGEFNIFVYNQMTGNTKLITKGAGGTGGNGFSDFAAVSGNGNIMAFMSTATDLIPGMTTQGSNIFVYNKRTNKIQLLTKGASGTGGDGPSNSVAVSGDGKIIVFNSAATDLIPGLTTNGGFNIFTYNLATGITTLITKGASGTGSIENYMPSLSYDGKYIAFRSDSTDLIPGITTQGQNVFLYNRKTGKTTLVTKGASGLGENGLIDGISCNGNKVAFSSNALDLIPGFTPNGEYNLYSYNILSGIIKLVSKGASGTGGDGDSGEPSVDQYGNIAFMSWAKDLIPGISTAGYTQVYFYRQPLFFKPPSFIEFSYIHKWWDEIFKPAFHFPWLVLK